MGNYLRHKLEYYGGSMGLLRLYRFWLTALALFCIITMTWKVTTSGYTEHFYFLMDFLVGGFAVIGLLSFLPCDRYTVFGNLSFLAVFVGVKGYKTYHFLSTQSAVSAPDGIAGMDGMMNGMGAAMGDMSMAASGMADMGGMVMDNMAPTVAVSPDMGFLGQMVQKFLNGPLKIPGDFSKFIVVTEFELFAVLCIVFAVMFVSQWHFYKTPLLQLRERG